MKKQNEPWIKPVNFGIASLIGDTIIINKNLKKYPELYKKTIEHEMKHWNGEKHVDLKENFNKEWFKFVIKHPSSWVQFLPLWIYEGKIIYENTMICLWAVIKACITCITLTIVYPSFTFIIMGCFLFYTAAMIRWLL